MEPRVRFELTTPALRKRCVASTTSDASHCCYVGYGRVSHRLTWRSPSVVPSNSPAPPLLGRGPEGFQGPPEVRPKAGATPRTFVVGPTVGSTVPVHDDGGKYPVRLTQSAFTAGWT